MDHHAFLSHTGDLLGEELFQDGLTGLAAEHSLRTAPVLTGDALRALGPRMIPQCALYGRALRQYLGDFEEAPVHPELLINTNAPFSAVVCGVQGSGKSHSTSVLLESCLIGDKRIGSLPAPLSGLVFHFDTAAGGGLVQPCEAAYLASLDAIRGGDGFAPDVTVLVLPTNLVVMRQVYAGLPHVRVEPLHFAPQDISGDRLLAMMKVDEGNQLPLYMESIMAILRDMEIFEYQDFRTKLKAQKFAPSQKNMLNLRLLLLDSCLKNGNLENRVSQHFKPGRLTIVDLSSPFMDGSSACGFFDLILGLFVEKKIVTGKIIVLDEAHKYLTDTGSSSRLTESLLAVVRQQRHLNTRVVVSTQEPTVVPSKLLELCSFVLAHRFSSPKWLHHLAQHVSAVEAHSNTLFSKIVTLQTGQAILFSPAGLVVRPTYTEDEGTVAPLGQGYLLVRSRLRITRDGGHSILAVADGAMTTRIGTVPLRDEDELNIVDAEETALDASQSQVETVDNDWTVVVGSDTGPVDRPTLQGSEEGLIDFLVLPPEATALVEGPGESAADGNDRKEQPNPSHECCILSEAVPSPAQVPAMVSSPSNEEPPTLASPLLSVHQRTASLFDVDSSKDLENFPGDNIAKSGSPLPPVLGMADDDSDYGTACSSPTASHCSVDPSDTLGSSDDRDDESTSTSATVDTPPKAPSSPIPTIVEQSVTNQPSSSSPSSDTPASHPVTLSQAASTLISSIAPPSTVGRANTDLTAVRNIVKDISEEYQPLIRELYIRRSEGQIQVSTDVIYYTLRDTASVPYYYKPFLQYLDEAVKRGLVVREGVRLSLGPVVADHRLSSLGSQLESNEQPSTSAALSSDGDLGDGDNSYILSDIDDPGQVTSASPAATTSTTVQPATPSPRIAPIIEILQAQRALGGDRCSWTYITTQLHLTSPLKTSLQVLLDEAVSEGWVEYGHTSSGVYWARLLREPIPANPAGPSTSSAGTSTSSILQLQIEPRFRELVKILQEQNTSTDTWSAWGALGVPLRNRASAHIPDSKKGLGAYLAAAEAAGIVELSRSANDKTARLSARYRALPQLRPLVDLFASTGKEALTLTDVDGLKMTHPGLIASGKGKVKAYAEEAVQAGIVRWRNTDSLVLA